MALQANRTVVFLKKLLSEPQFRKFGRAIEVQSAIHRFSQAHISFFARERPHASPQTYYLQGTTQALNGAYFLATAFVRICGCLLYEANTAWETGGSLYTCKRILKKYNPSDAGTFHPRLSLPFALA